MKKTLFLTITLLVTAFLLPAEDTRYNENMNSPHGKGDSGTVSSQTGALSFSVTDIALPGMNGLNFEVTRTYSSVAANVYNMKTDVNMSSSTTTHTPLDWKYGLGSGWSFGWPFIYRDIDGTGNSYKLSLFWGGSVFEVDKTLSSDQHENNLKYYYVNDIRIFRDDSVWYPGDESDSGGVLNNAGVKSTYCVELKNGTKYYFSEAGNLMLIKNPSDPGDVEEAEIWFYYKDHTPVATHDQYNDYRENAKIELVVDSIGRRIDFIYSINEENWLEEIRYEVIVRGEPEVRKIQYMHESLGGMNAFRINGLEKTRELVSNPIPGEEYKFLLSGFKNPLQVEGTELGLPGMENEYTRYEYDLYEAPFSFFSGLGRSYNYFINLTNIYSNYTNVRGNEIYKNRVVFEYNSPSGNYIDFQRPFATETGFMSIFKVTRQYTMSKRNEGAGTSPKLFNDMTYEYYGNTYGKPLNEYWTIQRIGGMTKTSVYSANNSEEENNLLKYEETEANNGEFLERVEYTYDVRKTLTSKSLYRDGIKKYTEQFIYNDYNDLINHKAPNGLITEAQYHETFHVPIEMVQRDIINGDGTTFDVRTINKIRESDGKVLSETVFSTIDGVYQPVKTKQITYDEYGNPIVVEDALGNTVQTIYDPEFHVFPEIVEMNLTLDGEPSLVRGYKLFNTDGSVWVEWDNDGYAIEHIYDVLGTEVRTIMPDEDDTTDFDPGAVTSAQDLLTESWQESRENNGYVEMEVDYRDESVLTYGEEFNSIRVKTGKFADGLGHIDREVMYEHAGSDQEYSVRHMSYDSLGRMIALTDPDAGSEYRMRTVMNTPVRMHDKTWLVWYDDLNRKQQVEYPDDEGNLVRKQIAYDDVNLIVTTTNTRGYDTIEEYDIDGNLVRILRPGVKDETGTGRDLEYKFEYNQLKQKIAFTDPLGERVAYSFDERGLLARLDYGNGADLMTYDKNGNLLTKIDRNESLLKCFYDEMGRNIRQEYFTDDDYENPYDFIELGYDGRGNLVKVDSRRLVEQMAYDSRARMMWVERTYKDEFLREDLAAKVDWITATSEKEQKFRFEFTYTPNNLVDSIQMPNGKSIQYEYDETKLRLSGINAQTDLQGDGAVRFTPVVTDLVYNKGGQVTRMSYGNNTTQYWEFDERKRIRNIKVKSGQQEILNLEYKVDTENNILGINDNVFAYDEMDRLIKSEIMRLGNVDYRLKVLDAFGTSRQIPVVADRSYNKEVDFNNDGRIDGYDHTHACVNWREPFDREEFSYDHNGNRRTLTQNGKEYVYYYSERNRLIRIDRLIRYDEVWLAQNPGQPAEEIRTIVAYAYDENGNTVERKEYNEDGSVTVYGFVYDIHNRLVSVLKDGASHASYIYDNGGMRMYKEENGKRTYYFRNGGTVLYEVEVDDEKQEVVENSYIVSGELLAGRITRKNGEADKMFYYHLDHLNSTKMVTDRDGAVVLEYEYRAFGTELDKIGSDPNRFSYIGREFDEEINLYYVNARYYDATIGRFINVDPIQDGWNWYVYCSNNPLKFTDPTGLEEKKIKDKTTTSYSKYTMDFDQARTYAHEYLVNIENNKERKKYKEVVDEFLNYIMSQFPVGGNEIVLFKNLLKIMNSNSKNNLVIFCSLMTVPKYSNKETKVDNPLAIGFQNGDYIIELEYTRTEQEKVYKRKEEGIVWNLWTGRKKETITSYSSDLTINEKMKLSLVNKSNNNILTQITAQDSTWAPGFRWNGERNGLYIYSLNKQFKEILQYAHKKE